MTVTTFSGSYAYWHGLGTSKVWTGEQFTSSAALYNEYVTKTEFKMKTVGSPTGSVVCKLLDASDNVISTLWTISCSAITSTTGDFYGSTCTEFQLQGDYTIMVEHTSGYDSSNYIAVNVGAPNQYDGSNSYSRLKEGSTAYNNTDNDYYMRITHESTSGGGSGGGGSGGGDGGSSIDTSEGGYNPEVLQILKIGVPK